MIVFQETKTNSFNFGLKKRITILRFFFQYILKKKIFTIQVWNLKIEALYLLLNSLMVRPKPIVPNALISAVVFSNLSLSWACSSGANSPKT